MKLRSLAAVLAGKLTYSLVRLTGSGGAALPGLVAERIDPTVLGELSRQCPDGVVLICGTNGKTTTSRLLADILASRYPRIVHNRSGSNLLRGHISAFLAATSWRGTVNAPIALLEVDEAVLPHLLTLVRPRAVLLGNLFRDQLDRYGEVDSIAKNWQRAIEEHLDPSCALLVNGDDPTLAYLARQSGHPVCLYFGLDDPSLGTPLPSSTVDAVLSPASGSPLQYSRYYLSHLGEYHDPESDFRRPRLDLVGSDIVAHSTALGSSFSMRLERGERLPASLPLAGVYNVYNALGASLAAHALSIDFPTIVTSLGKATGVFGRFERLSFGNKELILCLIKNPVGATEVLRTIAADNEAYAAAVFANDDFADGQDVSWYWDAGFELLRSPVSCLCSGSRAYDMQLRLKYAGHAFPIRAESDIETAFQTLLDDTSTVRTYVLATYTATLRLQHLLTARGVKQPYWQE